MKKTLLALATLSAMAGSAFAADVTLYGLVDYGFQYSMLMKPSTMQLILSR